MTSEAAQTVASPVSLEVRDWRKAESLGWEFRDRRLPRFGGRIETPGETLHLHADEDTATGRADVAYAHPISTAERFSIEFAARFHRLGLDDDSTGGKTNLRMQVGVKTPQGSFGVAFRFTSDRYDVGSHSKTFRTDGGWHTWRFEIDTARKTIAMYRDDTYICLHDGVTRQRPGVRIWATGVPRVPADVEIAGFSLHPLGSTDSDSMLRPLTTQTEDAPGEWRMWRRDVRNTGASSLHGTIRTPQVAWTFPVGMMAPPAAFLDLDGDGMKEALISHGGNLTAYRYDGTMLWQARTDAATVYGIYDLAGDGGRALVIASGTPSQLRILDAPTGKVLYVCPEFPMAGVAGVRIAKLNPKTHGLQAVVWSPQNEIGFCLAFDNGIANARVAWTFNWRATNFSPTVALADMDRDGILDVVVTTYDRTFVFDGRNGKKKSDYPWPSGRNYGITVVQDIDGDGYPDVIVLADYLREHIAVLKNEGGKSLKMLWDRFYEQDYPNDNKSLRLLTESVGDFDGDGKFEIAGSLYDGTADSTWHLFLLDALTGAVKQDIPGLCLIGAGPVFPDQPSALIVSRPSSRTELEPERLFLWSYQGGTAREVAALPEGALLTLSSLRDYAPNIWSTHLVNTTTVRPFSAVHPETGLFLARKGKTEETHSVEFLVGDHAGRLQTRWRLAVPQGYREVSVSTQERPHATRLLKQHEKAGRALDVADILGGQNEPQLIAASEDGALQIVGTQSRVLGNIRPAVGFVTAPVVARLRKGDPPCILVFDAKGDLLCLRASAAGSRPQILWSRPASGSRPYMVPYLNTHGVPVVADIEGNGDQVALVATHPDRLTALDAEGKEVRSWTLPDLPVQWACGNFDGDDLPDLFVTYPTGAFLDMESAILSGKDGRVLWKSHCGNGPPAVCDLNGDGLDDVLLRDLFERRTLDARAGHDILPITMWAGYHTPVVLPLAGPDNPPGVVWVGGMYSLVAEYPIGHQVWWRPFKATGPQAVADVDGDGRFEIGGVTAGQLYNWPKFYAVDGPDKEFLCYDALTGAVKWTYPLGTTSSGVVAADVDGDGKPEFLFGTADGRLIALRGGAETEQRVVWELAFPAALGPPIVADVDGNGAMAILVSCADGQLYCVKGR